MVGSNGIYHMNEVCTRREICDTHVYMKIRALKSADKRVIYISIESPLKGKPVDAKNSLTHSVLAEQWTTDFRVIVACADILRQCSPHICKHTLKKNHLV